MMISWATGYAAAHEGFGARSDTTALKIVGATLGKLCRVSPNKLVTQAFVYEAHIVIRRHNQTNAKGNK